MNNFEIQKDSIDEDSVGVSAFSLFIDGEEELFITPMHIKADKEHYEKLMRFISNSCQHMLNAAKTNNSNPFELAEQLNKQMVT